MKRVLIVEDEISIRESLVDLFASDEVFVVAAATLAESLEIADIKVGETNDHALIGEHLIACTAMEAMKKSLLGRIL